MRHPLTLLAWEMNDRPLSRAARRAAAAARRERARLQDGQVDQRHRVRRRLLDDLAPGRAATRGPRVLRLPDADSTCKENRHDFTHAPGLGAWLWFLGALVALAPRSSTISGAATGSTAPALLLVIASSALMLVLALSLARWRSSSRWAHGILLLVLLGSTPRYRLCGLTCRGLVGARWHAPRLGRWLADVVSGVQRLSRCPRWCSAAS